MRTIFWFVVLWLAVDALFVLYVWPKIVKRWDRDYPYTDDGGN